MKSSKLSASMKVKLDEVDAGLSDPINKKVNHFPTTGRENVHSQEVLHAKSESFVFTAWSLEEDRSVEALRHAFLMTHHVRVIVKSYGFGSPDPQHLARVIAIVRP